GAVGGRVVSVVVGVAWVVNGFAGGVERIVDGVVGSRGVGFDGVLVANILCGVFGLGFARGKAELEDRNGQCNLLHDRSIPCLWGAASSRTSLRLGLSRERQASVRRY